MKNKHRWVEQKKSKKKLFIISNLRMTTLQKQKIHSI